MDGRRVGLTNLDKVMYPSGFRKGEVIDYYVRIAPALLPHLAGRPLTLKRYPNGTEAGHFYEKRCPEHRPDWVATAPVWSDREDGEINFCVCDDLPTLVWVAQLASLELHPSLSLAEQMDTPTALAFDLDPGDPATIVECCRVGLRLRELFGDLGVECFPKSSGSKGLQVYVPLNSDVTYEVTKPYAQAVAQLLERQAPEEITSRMTKKLRKGKVFVDWSQNTETKTTVAAYSLRAKQRPTVSAPVEWSEVERAAEKEDPELLTFEAGEVLERVAERGDLFAPVLELEQELPVLDSVGG
ncbi:MAG TPA: non-homologous end-joining DNA ligase [Solirubrobacterales bacterium]|nr:non-homologous end-joining DNA ligase [Solirubrobacterales bacterium]